MKFGFYLPTRGHTATPEALETLVTRGEALGFHSVMIADHVVFPTEVRSRYPYTSAALNESLEHMEHFASVIKPAADRL